MLRTGDTTVKKTQTLHLSEPVTMTLDTKHMVELVNGSLPIVTEPRTMGRCAVSRLYLDKELRQAAVERRAGLTPAQRGCRGCVIPCILASCNKDKQLLLEFA